MFDSTRNSEVVKKARALSATVNKERQRSEELVVRAQQALKRAQEAKKTSESLARQMKKKKNVKTTGSSPINLK